MAKWDRPGVPHKGWTLVGYEDLKEDAAADDFEYETCEMCHNERPGMCVSSRIQIMMEKFGLVVTVPAK